MGARIRQRREVDIQHELIRWLTLRGVMCWRNNTGGATLASGHFARFGEPGSADILAVLRPAGRLLACEVKRPGKVPTALQANWLARAAAAGACVVVASSVQDLEEALAIQGIEL
jgi:hypothetical protein